MSLDLKRGGEIAQNLKRLYSYMQTQLLNAHMRQVAEPIVEVSNLLTTLLEGWRGAGMAETSISERAPSAVEHTVAKQNSTPAAYAGAPVYGGYLDDSLAAFGSTAYSF